MAYEAKEINKLALVLPQPESHLAPRSRPSAKSTADLLIPLSPNVSAQGEPAEECKKSPSSSRSRLDSFREKAKRLSLKCDSGSSIRAESGAAGKLGTLSPQIALTMKSRVEDAGLERFSDYLEEFSRRYTVGETIGEVPISVHMKPR